MKIKPQSAILIVLAIFISGITLASALGIWKTTAAKTPAKLKDPQYSESYNPSDIRGSYTFSDISRLYNIPIQDLAAAFSIDQKNAADFKCKDLESIYEGSQYEIGTTSVKMFTSYYLGLPYHATEETYLPSAAGKNSYREGQYDQRAARLSGEPYDSGILKPKKLKTKNTVLSKL